MKSSFNEFERIRSASSYCQEGVALLNGGKYNEALPLFNQSIQTAPNHAQAHFYKGVTLFNFKQYDEALSALEETIRIEPESFEAHHNKGMVLYQVNKNNKH